MAIQVTIDGVDRTRRIAVRSFKVTNVLTNRVDKCRFSIKTYGDQTYRPELGNEVIALNGATKIFGGRIVEIKSSPPAYKMLEYDIECVDYTRDLDRKLIIESYTGLTGDAILADLQSNWMPAGFTINNVDCPEVISLATFNFITVSKALKQLADKTNYDWYVDYDKDIHFFNKTANAAPMDIEDDNGSHIYTTLQLNDDNTQIKNVVIVRGGEFLGNTLTADMQANGVDFHFNLPYRFDEFSATLSATALNVGIDFSSDANDHDALWNRDEKVLKFKEADVPSNGALLKVVGKPYLPLLLKKYNRTSIEAMVSAEGGDGEYEYLIVDRRISTKAGARERASAELYGYAQTLTEGSFSTEVDGFVAGQSLRINSVARGIDKTFIINKVTIRMRSNNEFIYSISLMTTRTFGMIEMLGKIVENSAENQDVDLTKKEVLDNVEGADEFITINESTGVNTNLTVTGEVLGLAETTTAQSLDYDVEFVLGPYTWGGEGSGDTKRVFLINGSILS